jgi:hypothetical protein
MSATNSAPNPEPVTIDLATPLYGPRQGKRGKDIKTSPTSTFAASIKKRGTPEEKRTRRAKEIADWLKRPLKEFLALGGAERERLTNKVVKEMKIDEKKKERQRMGPLAHLPFPKAHQSKTERYSSTLTPMQKFGATFPRFVSGGRCK